MRLEQLVQKSHADDLTYAKSSVEHFESGPDTHRMRKNAKSPKSRHRKWRHKTGSDVTKPEVTGNIPEVVQDTFKIGL